MDIYSKNYTKQEFDNLKKDRKHYFENFYNNYYKLVYKIVFSILKNKENSEDITQNVFAKLYKIELNKLPSRNELSWLYSVTKNETITYLRNSKKDISLEEIYEISTEDIEIENIIEKDQYNKILDKLGLKEKEIVSLKVIGQLSFKEISKTLCIPIGTVQWHYYKALNTLKILISNISMCLITFILYLKTKNVNKISRTEQIENVEILTNQVIEEDTDTKDEEKQEQLTNQEAILENNIIDSNSTQGTAMIGDSNSILKNNVLSNGFLTLSSIFLIGTITFLIIFTKYQQNRKNKSSK